MASGTAFRCKVPNFVVLPCDHDRDPKPAKKRLYKAPPNKPSKRRRRTTTPLLPLPLEILHSILLHLDLPSIDMLRRVNTTGRLVVESLPAYSLLKKHASDTLRLMAATKCAHYFSISRLFAEFCQPWCRTCGDFGPYLYFPTATRTCYKCSFVDPEYEIAETSVLRLNLGLSLTQLRTIPIIHSIELQPSRRFASITQAKALAIQVHGSDKAIQQAHRDEIMKRYNAYQRRLRKWERSNQNGRRPRGPGFGEIRKYNHEYRGAWFNMRATALFPYWDRQTRTLEPGVYCRACTYDAEEMPGYYEYQGTVWDNCSCPRWEAYHRAFLEADIPEHFLNCPAVKQNYDVGTRKEMYVRRRKGNDFIVRPRNTTQD